MEKKKPEKITSFCISCGTVAEWEMKKGGKHEVCTDCAPYMAMLADAEEKIKQAELMMDETRGKRSAEERAQFRIGRELLVEADNDRRIAREKLYAIKQKRKHELANVAERN